MKLYTNPASPFCRKVDVVLHETGQRNDVEDIAAIGHPTDSANMPIDLNPMGKIPVLVTTGGTALYDSRVICRFLDDRAGGALCPTEDWEVMTQEALGDGICDAAILMVYEARSRPEKARYAPWVEGQWAKIARALDVLERDIVDSFDDNLTIGQIAVACALSYLDLRLADRGWRDGRSALAAWHAAFSNRPSMQITVPSL